MQQSSSPDPGFASPADLAACRAMLRQGSGTFHAASLLLPPGVRAPASELYAFCRLADDAVDLGEAGGAEDALAGLRYRLERAYDGRPCDHPVDRAFADVVWRYAVPRALPEALLEGFGWDAAGRRYDDLSGVHAYAARVAGTVGAMMAVLMGARSPESVARACDLGVAMQLSNIARDVGEDARAGRIYLPLRWLREAGIDPAEWLARPVFSDALGSVVQRLLDVADAHYARAAPGIAGLPRACRPGIHAARLLYAEIGRELERRGLDSVAGRAVVPSGRKATLLARAFAVAATAGRGEPAAPLEETRFLVDAVANGSPRPHRSVPDELPWWKLADRVVWIFELFERLERRQEVERTGGRT